jgi:type IV pilus assembly protein PilQ
VDPVAAPLASQAVQGVRSAEKMSQPVWVRSVNVIHGTQGIEVEIRSNGVLKPTATKITHPDRVVVDLENARTLRPVQVAVNSDFVKGVRMALFQANPPVTRVVVDLEAPRDYELVPSENGLRVKLRAPSQVASLGAPPVAPAAAKAITVLPKAPAVGPQTSSQSSTSNFVTDLAAKNAASATTPANLATPPSPAGARDFVVVQPTNAPKAEGGQPAVRAAEAASKFSGSKTEIALSNTPALPASLSAASAVDAEQQSAAPPQAATGKPKYTGEPISVNLKDVDLKDFFRLIHEISGLNVVLDPNVHGTLTLVLDDVPWDQALDIVLKNNGLERELDANVLRIATVDTLKHEATSRREEVEAQALAAQRITVTRFLSYAHSKDVVPTIKKFLSKRGEMVSDERTNALIIMDIPQVFPEIDRLLTQLDRKTPEVEIEARVVAATRNFARDIGTQLGFAWGNGKSTAVGGASAVGTSPIVVTPPAGSPPSPFITSGTSSGTTSGGVQIPLFSNLPAVGPTSGLSLLNFGSNYRLDVILTAAESRGLLKILSRPRVVTQNNIQAVVRQGVRIPVVTQAQLAGPATTTYVDAFLRLTVTPQITVENTIFLNVDVENTTPDFAQQVGGNPTLLTQQALTQVLVTDGGTVVIGGVISTKNSVAISQVPLLGSIPALGNLFKHRAVATETQELFFFITPKIIQT